MSANKGKEGNTVQITYQSKPLLSVPVNAKATIKDIKKEVAKQLGVKVARVVLRENSKAIPEDRNAKDYKKIELKEVQQKFKVCQVDNEENSFDFSYDLFTTSIDKFRNEIFSFFKKTFEEFNCLLNRFEFYKSNKGKEIFFDSKKSFASHFEKDVEKFYFLVIDDGIHFYRQFVSEEEEIYIKPEPKPKEQIQLRKEVDEGKLFKIAIQTYNHIIREVEVYPEMTVKELKERIEYAFLVRKEYQELIYLIYKLNDDTKLLKDYYIRPGGIIFLRGFYFPLIFVDFYERKNKKILPINIAEKIKYLRNEIVDRLGLDTKFNYKLIFNGMELKEEDFLIDYNVQKMQMIYFK